MAAEAYGLKHTRVYKYESENERHDAILKSKRNYYKRNADFFKLNACRKYYVKLLKSDELTNEKRERYQAKLNDIETKMKSINERRVNVIQPIV